MATLIVLSPKSMSDLLFRIEQSVIDYDREQGAILPTESDIEAVRRRVNAWVSYHVQTEWKG